jgi:hypothetical protein
MATPSWKPPRNIGIKAEIDPIANRTGLRRAQHENSNQILDISGNYSSCINQPKQTGGKSKTPVQTAIAIRSQFLHSVRKYTSVQRQ